MVLPPEHSTLGLSHLHHRVSAVTFHLPNDKAVLTRGTAVKTLLTFKSASETQRLIQTQITGLQVQLRLVTGQRTWRSGQVDGSWDFHSAGRFFFINQRQKPFQIDCVNIGISIWNPGLVTPKSLGHGKYVNKRPTVNQLTSGSIEQWGQSLSGEETGQSERKVGRRQKKETS